LKRTSGKCLLIARRQATLPVNLLLCPSSRGFCQGPVCTRPCATWVRAKRFSGSADLTDQLNQTSFSGLVAMDIGEKDLNRNPAIHIIIKFNFSSSLNFKRQKYLISNCRISACCSIKSFARSRYGYPGIRVIDGKVKCRRGTKGFHFQYDRYPQRCPQSPVSNSDLKWF